MIEVVKPGLFTTVQDLGRFGYRNMGVPVSGAMDTVSASRANILLGNTDDKAVLEITMVGPTLKFHQKTTIAIAGAPFEIILNATEIVTQHPISIQKNDVLQLGKAKTGMRCYLAVAGGLQTPLVLNSRSFYSNITEDAILNKGDRLPIVPCTEAYKVENPSATSLDFETCTLEVYPGPEFGSLSELQQKALVENEFKISAQSNRMAYVLECGVTLSVNEILTAPVQPGIVQVTPSGKLLVLMRDAQVTGGYARIFQLTEKSINILAQKRGGEQLAFAIRRNL